MSEFEDMINSVLSDPVQMEKISGLAKSLMGGSGPDAGFDSTPTDKAMDLDPSLLGRISSLMSMGQQPSDDKKALLEAMKPYLSEKRRRKMDKALHIARLARIAGIAMEEMGDKGNV